MTPVARTPLPAVVDSTGTTWHVAEPHTAVFEVDAALSARLAEVARRVAERHRDCRHLDDHDLLVDAEVAMRQVSAELVAELVRFRLALDGDGVLLLRGLPIDEPRPATPTDGALAEPWHTLPISTVVQLMVMSIMGDVISYADEKNGRLIQDICPVPGREQRQENSGSCLLELHTENGFHPNKPHFIGLLCLRPDHAREAMTVASGLRAVLSSLTPDCVDVLRQPLYTVRLASSFVGPDRSQSTAPIPVLTGSASDPDLCVDFHASEPLSEPARVALAELRTLLLGSLVGTVLEPGDMFVIDNRKAVHGRTGFSPRYDGTDRWLRRCFAVADIRGSQGGLFPRSRVHRPLTLTA